MISVQASWANFRGLMSHQAGYISAEENRNSMDMSGVGGPQLRRMSDVYFLIWKKLASSNKDLRNIKYFVRFHVKNAASGNIAKEACGNEIPYWPGRSFDMSTKEGRAILATPNGVGAAYFLINHKEDLGHKTITKVTVFKTDGQKPNGDPEDWYHFIFYVAPYSGKKKGKK